MARNIEELRAKLSLESLKRVDARVSRTLELMAMHTNRQLHKRNAGILRCAQDDGIREEGIVGNSK